MNFSVFLKHKVESVRADKSFGPQKCLIFLKMPWVGNTSLRFESQIKTGHQHIFRYD